MGVVTVVVTDDRLWIEQFTVSRVTRGRGRWFRRGAESDSEVALVAERRSVVPTEECYGLIEQSGLRLAKVARESAWMYRGVQ